MIINDRAVTIVHGAAVLDRDDARGNPLPIVVKTKGKRGTVVVVREGVGDAMIGVYVRENENIAWHTSREAAIEHLIDLVGYGQALRAIEHAARGRDAHHDLSLHTVEATLDVEWFADGSSEYIAKTHLSLGAPARERWCFIIRHGVKKGIATGGVGTYLTLDEALKAWNWRRGAAAGGV